MARLKKARVAASDCKNLVNALRVVPAPARAVEGWLDLLRRRRVIGGAVFDLHFAATMLANDVQRIYTYKPATLKALKS
jgi:hypothetical protein